MKPKKSGDKPRKRSDRERCAPFPLTTIYETLHDIAKHNHNLDPSKCELVARPCNLEMWYKNNRATSGAVNGFTEYKEELMLERFKARLVAKGAEQRGRSRFHTLSALLYDPHQYVLYLPLPYLLVGHYINWMSIMLFCMVTWKSRFTCFNHRVWLIQPIHSMFVNLERRSMALNRLPVPGTTNSKLACNH